MQRAIPEGGDSVCGTSGRDNRAIHKRYHFLGIFDVHAVVGRLPLYCKILKLCAINGIGTGGEISFVLVNRIRITAGNRHAPKYRG